MFFKVEGGLDESSLPATPRDSMAEGSSLFLVELSDPSRRLPIEWVHYAEGNSFLPPGSVSALPLLGAAVHGPAALVMTRDARRADGAPLGPSDDLLALMSCTELEGVEVQPDCEPYRALREALGRPAEEIAMMQIFTPRDATSGMERAFEKLISQPAPAISELEKVASFQLYEHYRGVVELEQFQRGTPPFHTFDGTIGGFEVGDDGAPITQRTESVTFSLTVPLGPSPVGGWPVVVYGHGTTGDLDTGVGEGERSEAHQLARAGWAMFAVSEPLHAGRVGFDGEGSEQLATFNFLNPVAGRDNWRQSALEKVQLVTAVENLGLSADVTGDRAVAFDPEQVGYMGHSQGGIVGAIYLGLEDRIRGAFLSGAGAGFAASLPLKTEPVSLPEVMSSLLSLPEGETVDRFHPVLALMQLWVEELEPINYGPLWRHRSARRTPHLVATSGLRDDYTPPTTHAGLAAAFELPLITPVAEPFEIVELIGAGNSEGPAAGNVTDGRGESLTAGMLQFPNDGHFAIYSNVAGRASYLRFFETLISGVPEAGGL
jgi:hypothetical protein